MPNLSLYRYVSPLLHVLVWVSLAAMLLIFQPLVWDGSLPAEFWIKQGILFCMWLSAYYLTTLVWVPKLLFEDKTGLFILAILATAIAIVLLIWQVELWFNLPQQMQQILHPEGGRSGGDGSRLKWMIAALFAVTLLVLGIGTSITAVQKWQADALLRKEEALLRKSLEQQKTSSELSFLKAQINPHFFFNTLNNIYSLTMLDVGASQQALLRLSRMMRYVLYETQKDTVLLSQEIAFLKDYIELMQLRLSDRVEVAFNAPGPLKEATIAPMLLLPFVENAFKHGVSALQGSRIYIAVRQEQKALEVEVRNTLFTEKDNSLEEGSGIGLVNTRRRLDLLYPGRYTLSVNEDTAQNEYQVNLTLGLS
ncbi:sensor histidine kinase [Pontibacter diazotrophicus]|uniref:Sensor histidine kinase n=1 Tax=Pontibacter diazotrophicus TaxID=1400979 RepID=A0A3D8LIE6_9BACT|nr:histidine kinase [Pontibacter diazotrophicus]RDV17219.1 sensor histidine kinase [Pontibacter diazotrophicus]